MPMKTQTLFALPILPGKTEQARAFLHALEGERKEQFAACERRLGVTKEVWAIQPGPRGDLLLCYFAAADVERVGAAFAASEEDFDVWFNAQLAEITGLNWNDPVQGARSLILAEFQA
jgi:hypothetical protein